MAQKRTNTKSSKKKNNGFLFTTGCVVLGLLIILIIFLVKKDQIFTNLKETAFFDRVFGSTPEVIENHEDVEKKQNEIIPLKNDVVTIQIDPVVEPEIEEPAPAEVSVQQSQKSEKVEKSETAQKSEVKKEEPKKEVAASTTETQLCFVFIDGDGSVVRKMIKRTVTKTDSPLTNSINLLLKGPDTTKSAEKNCMTVIPKGTKLLGAKVQNGVAYLSFNDSLEINEYGVEGIIHSLEQIVYTATAYSTVTSVQILIDGQKKDYLGEEGQWIGSPLSRNSF